MQGKDGRNESGGGARPEIIQLQGIQTERVGELKDMVDNVCPTICDAWLEDSTTRVWRTERALFAAKAAVLPAGYFSGAACTSVRGHVVPLRPRHGVCVGRPIGFIRIRCEVPRITGCSAVQGRRRGSGSHALLVATVDILCLVACMYCCC